MLTVYTFQCHSQPAAPGPWSSAGSKNPYFCQLLWRFWPAK